MDAALLPLVALACPIGMVLMMLFMGRGIGRVRPRAHRCSQESFEAGGPDLEALRAERARLDAQIAVRERQSTASR
jgi:hypothetical protein